MDVPETDVFSTLPGIYVDRSWAERAVRVLTKNGESGGDENTWRKDGGYVHNDTVIHDADSSFSPFLDRTAIKKNVSFKLNDRSHICERVIPGIKHHFCGLRIDRCVLVESDDLNEINDLCARIKINYIRLPVSRFLWCHPGHLSCQ